MLKKLIVGVLLKRIKKTFTSWLGGAVVATGGAAYVHPEILELIPENWRGTVIGLVGLAVIFGRNRRALVDAWKKLKADANADINETGVD